MLSLVGNPKDWFSCHLAHLSCLMGKPTICICENKGTDQLCANREADQCFVFATRIVQSLYFLNTKFHVSSCLLLLCSPVCVGPVRKPHCRFSCHSAHLLIFMPPTSKKLRGHIGLGLSMQSVRLSVSL